MYVEKCYRNRFKIASKGRVVLMVSAMLSCLSVVGHAAPTGGVVTTGSATIASSGTTTNINQSTQKASINWQGFSIASNETVNFNQPSASSITLNRVVGNETSVIAGALNANGKVFILNSNGILFSKGSSVNTSGLVASTLNLSDEDFNNNNFIFQGSGSQGSIINMGTITIANSGYAALLGKEVSNQGVIVATKGVVALSSGDKITLNFNGDSLMSVTIDEGTLNALVENKNAIYADGGKVILTAKAANDLLASQVNNEGLIQAQTLDDLKGEITLYAHGGTTTVSGTLDASAPTSGDGGFIETSGDNVLIQDTAIITTKATNGNTGTWLIDPTNFTITSGSVSQTTSGIGATTLANNLNNTDVTITTSALGSEDGDINVNAALTWSANTILTLNASDDININAAITVSGASAGLVLNAGTVIGNDININAPITLSGAYASLSMTYGGDYNIRTKASYSGTTTDADGNLVAQTDTSGGVYGSINFTTCIDTASCANTSLNINGSAYTLIGSMSQLDLLDGYNAATSTGTATTVTGNYALAHNLDADGTTYTRSIINNFNGTFVGLGHNISKLKINSSLQNTALFSETTSGSIIRDFGLLNVDITSTQNNTASLVATNFADISNVYATGKVSGTSYVAGLIATSGSASTPEHTLYSSFADVDVTGFGGGSAGLVGTAYSLKIVNSHSSGDVKISNKNSSNVGGLVGSASKGFILNSYATGDVYGGQKTGGLVGLYNTIINGDNFIENSFSTGNVFGTYNIGGLVGHIGNVVRSDGGFSIKNSYATGNITPTDVDTMNYDTTGMGGLVGYAITTGSGKVIIIDSYATGNINATNIANVAYLSVGGLVGALVNDFSIENSYATGDITGPYMAGGLVGQTSSSKNYPSQTISKSYATGNVSGNTAGGLVGGVIGSSTSTITVKDSYATGDVTGTGNLQVGGLIGLLSGKTSSIIGSYATGNVTGGNSELGVGGLVGRNEGSISNSYATGLVSGKYTAKVGGLVGYGGTKSVVINSYYNADLNSKGVGSGKGVSTGLSGDQVADAKYYVDGTINQVLANRAAAEKAARDAAAQTAAEEAARLAAEKAALDEHVANANQQTDAVRKNEESLTPLVTENTFNQITPPPLMQNITIIDPTYTASIKTIVIDGKTYVIEDDEEDKK